MKNKEPETNFEETLASFKREPIPASWKNEMLDKATSAPVTTTIIRPFQKTANQVAIGFLAACWVAIAFFKFTTPPDPAGTDLAARYGISEEQIPLIAQHFVERFQL